MHQTEVKLRTNVMGESRASIRPLNDAKAIANGATALAEGFLFFVGVSLVVGEAWRSSRSASKRRDDVDERLERLEAGVLAFERGVEERGKGEQDVLRRQEDKCVPLPPDAPSPHPLSRWRTAHQELRADSTASFARQTRTPRVRPPAGDCHRPPGRLARPVHAPLPSLLPFPLVVVGVGVLVQPTNTSRTRRVARVADPAVRPAPSPAVGQAAAVVVVCAAAFVVDAAAAGCARADRRRTAANGRQPPACLAPFLLARIDPF